MTEALIAVVNDDTTFLDLMTELLESEGYRARSYKIANQAYAALRAARPALILVDIRMETPEAGWQLIELLRLDPAMRPIPLIACSADVHFLREKAVHLRERDCAILEKPFDLDDLLAKVAEALALPRASAS